MPRCRRSFAFLFAPPRRGASRRLTTSPTALLGAVALLAVVVPVAGAQESAASDTPLHLAASHFEFVASADSQPASKPLRVHNGGTIGFTGVRLTRLVYADSAAGAAWLVTKRRQTTVAPDELATVGTLCVDAAGLPAGTYRATAAVAAREVPEPVAITITLVVTGATSPARQAVTGCTTADTNHPERP